MNNCLYTVEGNFNCIEHMEVGFKLENEQLLDNIEYDILYLNSLDGPEIDPSDIVDYEDVDAPVFYKKDPPGPDQNLEFDEDLGFFKFNEIRGSDVVENSKVEDVNLYLQENKLRKNSNSLNENKQEIASFCLVIPIIYDNTHRWFLALGKKSDESIYNKKDEKALVQLAERIKLSLKFILAYEEIVHNKYHKTIAQYEQQHKEKDELIEELRKNLISNE